jgi:hypothetical protein
MTPNPCHQFTRQSSIISSSRLPTPIEVKCDNDDLEPLNQCSHSARTIAMEPPAKRPRQGLAPYDDADADDELFLEPEEINAQRDPAVQLEQSRAVAAYKLKSRWEHIFEKYGKDFTDEGDEIDMATGEVVVDNGHIRSLEDADDTKSVAPSEDDIDEEERILHGKGGGGQLSRLAPGTLMRDTSYHGQLPAMGPSLFGTPRLSTMFSPGIQFPTPLPLGSFRSFSSFVTPNKPVEPTWEVPELPIEAYEYSARAMSKVMPRKVARRSLAAVQDSDGDDDDILMGDSSSRRQETEKRQAVSPIAPAVTPPARLLLTQTPATPIPKSLEPSSTVDEVSGEELAAHLAAALHAVDDSPEGSRLPTPPPTDRESNTALEPREPAKISSLATKRNRRRIEVVIVQYAKKLPIPPDVVAEDPEDASIPKSDARMGEGSGDTDNRSAVLPSGEREPVIQQSSATCETTPANEAARTPEPEPQTPELQLPELHPPRPVTPTEAAQPAETADAVQAETPPSVRRRRRDRINPRLGVPESSELTHRPIRHARQSDVQTKLKKPPRQSLPSVETKSKAKNSANKNRRHTLPASFPNVQPGSTANDHQDDDIFDIPQDEDIILEQQDQQQTPGERASRLKAPRQEKAPQQPELAPAPVIEQFSRNMIDSAYDFSDEEELFLPRQGKQITAPNSKQASVSQQAPGKRRGRPPKASKPPPPREQSPPLEPSPPPKPSPPRGKAFRSDRKRLPTTEKPGNDIPHDNRQLFVPSPPGKSLPPASQKPNKIAQRLFDMRKQLKESRITGEPASSPPEQDVTQEQPPALDQRRTATIETPVPVPKIPAFDRRLAMRRKHPEPSTGIEELPSSPPRLDFVREHSPVPDQTLVVETPVPVPQVPHVEGSVVRKRRRLEPSHEVEEGLPSSSRADVVQEHESVLDQTPAIETPVPTPILPHVDSSPTKRRKRPSAPTRLEEIPNSPPGIDLIHRQPDRQPKTPSHRANHKTPASRLSSSRPSTSKHSIISLVSDDEDEDELSLTLEQISPLKVQSDGKKQRQLMLSESKRNRKTATPNSASSVKRSAINRARMLRTHKNKARWRRSTGMSISSPAPDLIRTPGGTMRKCGEDGFKCERDFCFVCL